MTTYKRTLLLIIAFMLNIGSSAMGMEKNAIPSTHSESASPRIVILLAVKTVSHHAVKSSCVEDALHHPTFTSISPYYKEAIDSLEGNKEKHFVKHFSKEDKQYWRLSTKKYHKVFSQSAPGLLIKHPCLPPSL